MQFALRAKPLGLGLLSAASVLVTLPAGAAEPDQCASVRIAEVDWTDITATTALTTAVLRGLGYKVQPVVGTVQATFNGLKSKKYDFFLGYWKPSMDADIAPFVKSGDVKVLPTPNLTGAKYTLAVPSYAAEGGLKTFADLVKFKEKLGYNIYGIEPGNDGNRLIKDMIDKNTFNLKDFLLVEWGEKGMLSEVQRAVGQKRWIVFLAWEPHPMNVNYKLTYLSGGDKVFGPNFGEAKVYTVVAPDYMQRCTNVAKLLNNLQFSLKMENEVMGALMDKVKPDAAAKAWLAKNPDVLKTWLNGVTTLDGKDGLTAVTASLGQ